MKIRPQKSKIGAMAKLLASHKDSIVPLHKGEVVKGKIKKLTSSEILVDVGAKTLAQVLEKDKDILRTLLRVFKEGQSVEVLVLTPESETGQPIISLRRYLGNLSWKKLEELIASRESVDVTVSDVTKSGYVVSTSFGASGFLPQSHVSHVGNQNVGVGDKLSVVVLEINRNDKKIIFSQKPVFTDEEFGKLVKKFKPDQKVSVAIAKVVPFGIFVTLPVKGEDIEIEGFIHVSEVSWDKVEDLTSRYEAGESVEAIIVKFDKAEKRVQLSIKRLTKDPFEEVMGKYPVEKQVSGVVEKIESAGVSIDLGDGVKGLIKAEKISPTSSYKEGQEVKVLVSEYDKRRRRVFVAPVLKEKPIGYR